MFNFFEKKDSKIQDDVVKELKWDPSITSEQITVTVKDGIVNLRGNVPHYYEKSTAENAAQRVGGVRAVTDEIEVNLMGTYERDDSDIAEAALTALKWNYSVPKGIHLAVEKGWITLKGETEWEYQRHAAKNAVSQLMGVIGVSNDITLTPNSKPHAKITEVENNIQDAFKRSAKTEGNNIEIKIKGNQVTLSGKVHSYSEIEDASFAAWCSPGVFQVENNLEITN
ncbi:MAG: BON domain-containing protein [Bdellovibrionales bacterium]|nr:BON domain-containing protein [Bdellovibrionales bacterium]